MTFHVTASDGLDSIGGITSEARGSDRNGSRAVGVLLLCFPAAFPTRLPTHANAKVERSSSFPLSFFLSSLAFDHVDRPNGLVFAMSRTVLLSIACLWTWFYIYIGS